MKKKKPVDGDTLNFELALAELETLVNELETGELGLAESLQKFERGVTLVRHCQQSLDRAKQKIQTLSEVDHKRIDDVSDA